MYFVIVSVKALKRKVFPMRMLKLGQKGYLADWSQGVPQNHTIQQTSHEIFWEGKTQEGCIEETASAYQNAGAQASLNEHAWQTLPPCAKAAAVPKHFWQRDTDWRHQ